MNLPSILGSSDALALAVRKKCPAFIAESLVDEAGVSVNLIVGEGIAVPLSEMEGEHPMYKSKDSERQKLAEELEKAVNAEDYERAAAIRDLLRDLDNN
ncbi:hypothetical protein MASR2M78_23410 [Treponema sp.]